MIDAEASQSLRNVLSPLPRFRQYVILYRSRQERGEEWAQPLTAKEKLQRSFGTPSRAHPLPHWWWWVLPTLPRPLVRPQRLSQEKSFSGKRHKTLEKDRPVSNRSAQLQTRTPVSSLPKTLVFSDPPSPKSWRAPSKQTRFDLRSEDAT